MTRPGRHRGVLDPYAPAVVVTSLGALALVVVAAAGGSLAFPAGMTFGGATVAAYQWIQRTGGRS